MAVSYCGGVWRGLVLYGRYRGHMVLAPSLMPAQLAPRRVDLTSCCDLQSLVPDLVLHLWSWGVTCHMYAFAALHT